MGLVWKERGRCFGSRIRWEREMGWMWIGVRMWMSIYEDTEIVLCNHSVGARADW